MKWQRLYTGNATRHLEETTIEMGVPASALMETAGAGAADIIQKCFPNLIEAHIFTGKGNNGGDGWVVARYLASKGIHVVVYHPGKLADLTPDARAMADVVIKMAKAKSGCIQTRVYPTAVPKDVAEISDNRLNVNTLTQKNIPPNENLNTISPDQQSATIIIDALLGTGLTQDVRPDLARQIQLLNESNVPIVSLDVPTGFDATTGQIHGSAVRATHTIGLGTLKTGMYMDNASEYCGQRHLVNLGFVSDCLPERYLLQGSEQVDITHPVRAHKYASGVVYVIGGSPGMVGAAVIAAKAAWKSGCGAVHLMVPGSFVPLAEQLAPELIIISAQNSRAMWLQGADAEVLIAQIQRRPGTVLLGPGLGRNEHTASFVKAFLSNYNGQVVVDADALHYVKSSSVAGKLILTPHPGEWSSLIGDSDHSCWNRLDKSEQYAQQSGNTIVSKGYPTYVCSPDAKSWITAYDTRRFNRAGFGDVLAGSIAGNLSLTNDITMSCLKALVNGKLRFDKAHQEGNPFPEPQDLL